MSNSKPSRVEQISVVYPDGAKEVIYSVDGTSTPGPISTGDFDTAAEYAVEASKRQTPVVGSIRQLVSTATGKPSPPGSDGATTGDASLASAVAKSEQEQRSLTSRPAAPRSRASTRRWQQPKDARALAKQMSKVATMLLNGEIDREVAHQYTQMMRPTVQALSAVVYQARAEKTVPDLTLDDEDLFEEE